MAERAYLAEAQKREHEERIDIFILIQSASYDRAAAYANLVIFGDGRFVSLNDRGLM